MTTTLYDGEPRAKHVARCLENATTPYQRAIADEIVALRAVRDLVRPYIHVADRSEEPGGWVPYMDALDALLKAIAATEAP